MGDSDFREKYKIEEDFISCVTNVIKGRKRYSQYKLCVPCWSSR